MTNPAPIPTASSAFRPTTTRPRRRRLLAGWLAACAVAVASALATPLPAQAQSEQGFASEHQPITGQPFFILTDTQFGSQDEARVRVEVPDPQIARSAMEAYGGMDVVLYRVPRPLEFLKAQKNLHRVDVRARPRGEGLANTLSYLWDNAWKKSRFAWRDVFSAEARRAVTGTAPALKSDKALLRHTQSRPSNQFKPLDGYEVVDRFRYPIWQAKPIAPPEGVKLMGSSSEFIAANEGNLHIPLGKRKPGLYLVEAIVGSHRALTLLFVSDSVAITKSTAGALTVWTARRDNGQPVAGTTLAWTDGVGTLKSGSTDADGLATLSHASPERTYLLGEDSEGGVFVSENFYYDSEIYDAKLYAVTDRPLYRPGDLVRIKLSGREFVSARVSRPLAAGEARVTVTDPNGTPVLTARLDIDPASGADTAFRLPENAVAGGYDMRIAYRDNLYGAAFRVAEYVKPHFEITLVPDQKNYKTGEAVGGRVKLAYPDGKPVANAAVELNLRAQHLTMVEGELRYGGLFPVQLSTESLKTDTNGEARFNLPPSREPSRLILTLNATDGAAYRVRSTRELLVERAAATWKLVAARQFSAPGEAVRFKLESVGEAGVPPAHWETIRLEDQSRSEGSFDSAAREWTPKLDRPGSYSLLLRDEAGNIVAAASHWVTGEGIKVTAGSIEMTTDREKYRPGDTAEVLIAFPDTVDEALLTLERDQVEATALLSRAQGWISAERLAGNLWRARVPIKDEHGPNITLSAVYVKNGDYVFQNAGLVVEPPRLEIDIRADKDVVGPGDTVTVDIATTLDGKPAPAMLTVGVVDEMIYALQPEIAPGAVDFFFHPRRNNVRTGASLNFIAYDEAMDHSGGMNKAPARHQYAERGVKVLERPRRDDTDTAAWLPALATDASGRARFSFRMPDALSRWRITVRAMGSASADGVPGQRIAHVRSDKPLYAKWTSPTWLRQGDQAHAALAVFNSGNQDRQAVVSLTLGGKTLDREASLKPGVTYLNYELPPFSDRQSATIEVKEGGKVVDALDTPLRALLPTWRGPREQLLAVGGSGSFPLKLPADARELRVRFVSGGAEHFLRIADDLLAYPWGCVEQTASRIIPLALVTPLLAANRNAEGPAGKLWQTLYTQRLRLASLAGPDAVFGWWGRASDTSALMTAYAYYADWYAARTLNIDLPPKHWENVLKAYQENGVKEPVLHRALSLWLSQEIGLPVRTQTEGLLQALARLPAPRSAAPRDEGSSPFLGDPDTAQGHAYARALTALVARNAKLPLGADFEARLDDAWDLLDEAHTPAARALGLLAGREPRTLAPEILASVRAHMPTLDRALTLVWSRKALGGFEPGAPLARPAAPWQAGQASFGQPEWSWPATSPLPDALEVERQGGGDAPITAVVRYEANESPDGAGKLAVQVERRLYRLVKTDKGYQRTPVKPEDGLATDALYLDEITLVSKEGVHHRGLVEAALPPGAAIETGTWGIALLEGEQAQPLERALAEARTGSYGVPVDSLQNTVTLRHLLRVAQPGRFVLPPARYFRMYQPEDKAYADGGKNATWVVK